MMGFGEHRQLHARIYDAGFGDLWQTKKPIDFPPQSCNRGLPFQQGNHMIMLGEHWMSVKS